LVSQSPLLAGLLASLVGGTLATTAGSALVFLVRSLPERTANAMLAFAAGVMLAATVFSLLLPGIEAAKPLLGGEARAVLGMIAALGLGGLALWAVHRAVPHEHFTKGAEGGMKGGADGGHDGPARQRHARVWFFVLAITLHNFPEGLAIGFGAASGDLKVGAGVTLGIGLQNIPEGLAVALSLLALGYTRSQAFLVGLASGAVEFVGGAMGALLLQISGVLLPGALGFAAGAMLFVISHEVIPETHRANNADSATAALFVGFSMMVFLDVVLG
jgi:ZIP family zinc transporter